MRLIIATLFLAVSVLAWSSPADAQTASVSGYAFLADRASHGGIKVVMVAVSPTALSDSTLTDSAGFYTKVVNPGVYAITFSKDGYIPHKYADETLIAGTIILDTVTLLYGNLREVSGNVFGVWRKDTLYSIVGNLIVWWGDTLLIEPGTTIAVQGSYRLDVWGTLVAQGTKDEYITFTSGKTTRAKGDWAGILITADSSFLPDSTGQDTIRASSPSILSYCVVEYGASPGVPALITCYLANPTIRNCIIRESLADGISFSGRSYAAVVQGCEIYNNNGSGITCSDVSPTIVGNNIHDNWAGIDASSSDAVVSHNKIHGNMVAVKATYQGRTIITYNDIYQNSIGNSYYGLWITNASPQIEHNDIYNNGGAAGINIDLSSGGSPLIRMNIISDNTGYGIVSSMQALRSTEVSYNIFWNNTTGALSATRVGLGTVITVNPNGDSIDAYFNLFQNPDFTSVDTASNQFLHLSPQSPCIDAGGTNLITTDTSDIGSHPFQGALGIDSRPPSQLQRYSLGQNYPNPFNPVTDVRYGICCAGGASASGGDVSHVSLKVYDVMGREVVTLVDEVKRPGEYTVQWNAGSAPSGVYFYQLRAGNFTAVRKMLLIR